MLKIHNNQAFLQVSVSISIFHLVPCLLLYGIQPQAQMGNQVRLNPSNFSPYVFFIVHVLFSPLIPPTPNDHSSRSESKTRAHKSGKHFHICFTKPKIYISIRHTPPANQSFKDAYQSGALEHRIRTEDFIRIMFARFPRTSFSVFHSSRNKNNPF